MELRSLLDASIGGPGQQIWFPDTSGALADLKNSSICMARTEIVVAKTVNNLPTHGE